MKYECDQSTVCTQTHQRSCIFQLLMLDKEPSCNVQNTGMLFAHESREKEKRKKQSIMRWADVTATLRENISSPLSICTPVEAREKKHTNPHIVLNTNLCVYCLSYSELASTSPSRLLANECHYRYIMITQGGSFVPTSDSSVNPWCIFWSVSIKAEHPVHGNMQSRGKITKRRHRSKSLTLLSISNLRHTRATRTSSDNCQRQQERRDKTSAAATLIFQSFFTRRHI